MRKVNLLLTAALMACIPLLAQETMTDINGREYKTIKIRSQVWMAENLNVDKFRNGDPIPEAKTAEEWVAAGEAGEPAWCYQNNDPANGEIYGKLYNFFAVNDPRGLAPEGWRVATDKDWSALITATGGSKRAGDKLKSADGWGTGQWADQGGGSNQSGFAALPGESRSQNGIFNAPGFDGRWWTATLMSEESAWYRHLNFLDNVVERHGTSLPAGLSVRCLQDL